MEISAKIVVTKDLVKSILNLSVSELLELGFNMKELACMSIVSEHEKYYCDEKDSDVFYDNRNINRLYTSDGKSFVKKSMTELDREAHFYLTGEYAE